MNVSKNIFMIFKKNGFFDYIDEPLFFGSTDEEIKNEASRNIFTFSLDDEDKDIVTPGDLKAFIDHVREIKVNEIKNRKINRPIVFRVWHDTMDNWLRYNFLSKDEVEMAGIHKNPNLTFVGNIEDVFVAFLSNQEKNREPLIVPGEEAICPLSILEEEEKSGIVSDEFYIGNFDEDDEDTTRNYTSYEEILYL